MELQHRFSVPTGVEETWALFDDVRSVAECFPGATVTSAENDGFAGSVKVKLGPIALVYNGSGTFVSKDEDAHRFVVEAKGKDKRGNGTAGATVTLSMSPSATGTDVEVMTDLAITGKPAQFGRGVMQDVSDKLLGQFVACLEQRLTGPPGRPEPVEPSLAPPPPAAAAEDQVPPVSAAPADATEPPAHRREADALDVGAAAVPALLRAYGAQLGVALGGVLVVGWVLRRVRGRRRR